MATVILGSGIVGVSTAYYLSQSQDPSTIHLVDPSPTLFASASGLAGGFLARDWFQQSVAALGALSFEEHRLLAEKFGGAERWGFAWNTAWNHAVGGDGEEVDGSERKEEPTREVPAPHEGEGYGNGHTGGPIWLKRNAGDEVERVSGKLSTAVVWVVFSSCSVVSHIYHIHRSELNIDSKQ
jgi:glycine/D-amino acid oxidase-like deaminating enzyme